jgi:hypothetical protein
MEIKACNQTLEHLQSEHKKLTVVSQTIDKEFKRIDKKPNIVEGADSAVEGQINSLHFNS